MVQIERSLYLKYHRCSLPELLRNDDIFELPPDPSAWQKFRTWCQACVIVSTKNPMTRIYFTSNLLYRKEQKRQMYSWQLCTVIHPFSSLRMYWEMFMFFVTAMILAIYPLEMGFVRFCENSTNILTMLTICDIACFLDVIVNLRTGYAIESTREVVMEPGKIAKRYMKTYLIPDLIASFPCAYFAEVILLNVQNQNKVLIYMIKLYYSRKLLNYTKSICYLLDIGPATFQLIKHTVVLLIEIQWVTAIFYKIPKVMQVVRGYHSPASWIERAGVRYPSVKFSRQYIMCLYQTLATLLTLSYGFVYPETPEDYWMMTFGIIFGHATCNFLFVLFLQKALSQTDKTIKSMAVMSEITEYMKHKQLNLDLQRRVKTFYKYRLLRSRVQQDTINSTLTDRLRAEIQLYCNQKLVDKVTLFSHMPTQLIKKLVPFLKEEIFLPNDELIKAGTEDARMFFIIYGTVALYSAQNVELAHLCDGAYFGEVEMILKDQIRTTTIKAIEITEVLILEKKYFQRCFNRNFEAFKILVQTTIDNIKTYTEEQTLIKKKLILLLESLETEYIEEGHFSLDATSLSSKLTSEETIEETDYPY